MALTGTATAAIIAEVAVVVDGPIAVGGGRRSRRPQVRVLKVRRALDRLVLSM